MIFQHYKGGIYLYHEIARTVDTEELLLRSPWDAPPATFVATARLTDDITHEVDVVYVTEELGGGKTYIAYCENLKHEYHVFYQGLDGQFWLRPKDEFFGNVNESTPRFKMLSYRETFEVFADLRSRFFDKSNK